MKAVMYSRFGPPEVLELREVETPTPKDREVLIRIHATTVTSGDARLRALDVPFGFRLITRLVFGIKRRKPLLGMELAGEVERIGKDVTVWKKGDQVFGASNLGGNAEYRCLPEDEALVAKPAGLSYEEAAAVTFGSLSSLVFLRDFGKIQRGQSVLIIGASGCLGTFAVQLAKHFGAHVTGVCSTRNVELVQSLGADAVIDYTRQDLTAGGEAYDLIFETVGKVPFARCKHALRPKGRCLLAVAGIPDYLNMLWPLVAGGKRLVTGVAPFRKADLEFVTKLIEAGHMRPVIDRRYRLEEIVEAHRYVDGGHKTGSVVVVVRG